MNNKINLRRQVGSGRAYLRTFVLSKVLSKVLSSTKVRKYLRRHSTTYVQIDQRVTHIALASQSTCSQIRTFVLSYFRTFESTFVLSYESTFVRKYFRTKVRRYFRTRVRVVASYEGSQLARLQATCTCTKLYLDYLQKYVHFRTTLYESTSTTTCTVHVHVWLVAQ